MNTKLTGKFIEILRTFSIKELKAFEKWLNSPFANPNKNLPRLLEKLKKHHPNYDHRFLTKERLFKHFFPKKKYNTDWLNNLLSQGYLQAERFLICQNTLQNKNLCADLLATEFQNRHLENSFFNLSNREANRLEEKEIKDWEDHLELLRLNRRLYHHPNQNPRMKPGSPTIVKMNDSLTLVYLLEKAMIINEMIFRNRILKNENHDIQKELKIWRTAAEGINNLTIEFYRKRFGYTEKNMVEEYFELREMFFERSQELNRQEQRIQIFSLINDTAFLKNRGKVDIAENLPLYKLGLKSGILLQQGKLTRVTFTTIVSISNHVEDFDFSEVFIKTHTKHLAPEIQKDGKNWALAHTSYRKGNLGNCLKILIENTFKNDYFQIVSKVLTLQTYFDLCVQDPSYQFYFFNLLDAFEKWIQREQKISKNNKTSLSRFSQKSRILIKYLHDVNSSEKNLENLFISGESVQAINWLKTRYHYVIKLKK